MLAVKTLEETSTHELVTRALEADVIQHRDNGIYYGGCTRVADDLTILTEILDDDPDFLEQLHFACQPLGYWQEEGASDSAGWPTEDIQGITLGAYFPDQDAEENLAEIPETAATAPEEPAIDEDLVKFLASPEGAEIRKGLQADAQAARTSVQQEIFDEAPLPLLEDFIREQKQPLEAERQHLKDKLDRLRAEADRTQGARHQLQVHLQNSKGHPRLEEAFRRQIAAMPDPDPELTKVEAAYEALQEKLAACLAQEANLQANWEEINARIADQISAHPTIQFLSAVEQALADRRSADLCRLLSLIGEQSNQTILEQADRSDLGAEKLEVLNTALSSRKWVKAITPVARKLAASVAATKEFNGRRLPGKAQAIILRAENILILNQQHKEIGRIKVWPDGRGRWSRGQQGRPWKAREGTDLWRLNSTPILPQ